MFPRIVSGSILVIACLVGLGVFLTLVSIPLYGAVSYHRAAPTESWLIVGCAAMAPILLLMKKPRWTLVPALGVWLVLLFPMIKEALSGDQGGGLQDILDRGVKPITDAATNFLSEILEFEWGGWVFCLACLLFPVVCGLTFLVPGRKAGR